MISPEKPQLQTIDPTTLDRLLSNQQAILFDVREAGEHAAERIAGSVSLPL
jgi:rhodanese-related sulfurtransferase